jgi:hypothetical protein
MMLAFPYSFCGNCQHYLGRTQSLPVDGRLVLALVATQPLYVGSAQSNLFSDPRASSWPQSRHHCLHSLRQTGIARPTPSPHSTIPSATPSATKFDPEATM